MNHKIFDNLEKLAKAKADYNTKKRIYEMQLLELKYSEAYSIYKTIKEKEERAKLELKKKGDQVTIAKNNVLMAEYEVTRDQLLLQYMNIFDQEAKSCDCDCEYAPEEPSSSE